SFICVDRLVRARHWLREDTSVAIEGFGNAGSWLAIILEEMGYPVVAVTDSKGGVCNLRGLAAKDVLAHKKATGSVVGFAEAETIEGEDIMGVDCTVLTLAALEESVHVGNAERIKAPVILETANYPVTADADPIL